MQHPAEGITRFEDASEGRSEDGRVRVDELKNVHHVFLEQLRRYFSIEGLHCRREGLSTPDGGDERFACEEGELG